MSDVSTWNSAAASNNSAAPNGFPEGMAPSGLNDAAREVMAAVRRWFEDAQWINLGHTPTRVDGDTFTVAGDQTAIYHVGRRIRASGSATGYASISAVAFTTLTTVDVTMDSGTLPATLSAVAVSILSFTNPAVPLSQIATDRLVGRDTAGTGATEQLTVGGGLEFSGGGGIQRSALTGNVTAPAGSNATTIANDAVSNAMLANFAADTLVKGRAAGAGAGDPQDLTAAQLVAIITTADGAGSGLDADLLDGSSSAAFAAASHTHANGDLTGYTAADVLAKLVTVDGAGSGLDADLLDGSSSAAFAAASHTHAEGDITDGAILARVASTETISATWTYSSRPRTSSAGGFLSHANASNLSGVVEISTTVPGAVFGSAGDIRLVF